MTVACLNPRVNFYPLRSSSHFSGFKLQDRDGQATIIALRTIHKGEEVLSYMQYVPPDYFLT